MTTGRFTVQYAVGDFVLTAASSATWTQTMPARGDAATAASGITSVYVRQIWTVSGSLDKCLTALESNVEYWEFLEPSQFTE